MFESRKQHHFIMVKSQQPVYKDKETYVLYSLTGKDLYHGTPGFDHKHSYHESGKKHTKTKAGEYLDKQMESHTEY